MSDLSALIGVDFSLLGTKLRAAYEKKGSEGYAVLLMPTEQTAAEGVNIGTLVKDIQRLVGKKNDKGTKQQIETELSNSLPKIPDNVSEDGKNPLDSITVKLQMAYLYISKKGNEELVTEYAFKLDIITEGLVPEEITDLVDVQKLTISVWSTERQKILEMMELYTISECLEEKPEALQEKAGA